MVKWEMKNEERNEEKRRVTDGDGLSRWRCSLIATPWNAALNLVAQATDITQPTAYRLPGLFQAHKFFFLKFLVTPLTYLSQNPKGGFEVPPKRRSFKVISLTTNGFHEEAASVRSRVTFPLISSLAIQCLIRDPFTLKVLVTFIPSSMTPYRKTFFTSKGPNHLEQSFLGINSALTSRGGQNHQLGIPSDGYHCHATFSSSPYKFLNFYKCWSRSSQAHSIKVSSFFLRHLN